MSTQLGAFDAYLTWLGIPVSEQPPNHYRLLSLTPFESNPRVIQAAAEYTIQRIRSTAKNDQIDLANRLLKEVHAAQASLLEPIMKSCYDEQLKKLIGDQPARSAPAALAAADPASENWFGILIKTKPRVTIAVASGSAGVLVVVALLFFFLGTGNGPNEEGTSGQKISALDDRTNPAELVTSKSTGARAAQSRESDDHVTRAEVRDNPAHRKTNVTSEPPATTKPKARKGAYYTEAGDFIPDTSGPPLAILINPPPARPSPIQSRPVPSTPSDAVPATKDATKKETASSTASKSAPAANKGPSPDKPSAESDPKPAESQGKHAVPDAPSRAKWLAKIKQEFSAEFASREAKTRHKLAVTLFETAGVTTDDPAKQYVLYQQAVKLATDLGNLAIAVAATDAIGSGFDVDAEGELAELLKKLVRKARTPQAWDSLTDKLMPLVDQFAHADRYDEANQLLRMVRSLSSKIKDEWMMDAANKKATEINAMSTRFSKIKFYFEFLEKDPNDIDANYYVGLYRCATNGDWKAGLPMLAKGSNEALRKLAERTVADTDKPGNEYELAEQWWQVAEGLSAHEKANVQRFCADLYRDSLPELDDQEKQKVERRLAELSRPATTAIRTRIGRIRAQRGEAGLEQLRTKARALIQNYDKNKDGMLQPEERERLGWKDVDMNQDQIYSLDELTLRFAKYEQANVPMNR